MTITTTPRTTTGTTHGTGRTAARTEAVSKFYGTGDAAVARARRRHASASRGPVHRDHGPLGLRQVDAAARARRPRPADLGRGLPRRHRDHLAQGQGAHPAAPRPDRLHLPVVQPAPDPDRGREHRAADADRRPQAGRRTGWPSIVETVGLTGRLGHRPSRALRRPAAARRRGPGAGLAGREIVFADEPTGALDSRSGAELLGFLRTAVDGARPDRRHGHPRRRPPPATPTGSSSSPTATSSTRCTHPPPTTSSTT